MPEKRKIEIIRFVKGEVLTVLAQAYPEHFAGKSLTDLVDYGDDPNDSSFIRFVFKEQSDE